MTTKSNATNQIETLREQAAKSQAEAAEQAQLAATKAAEAHRVEMALAAHRERGSIAYHNMVAETYSAERDKALQAVADARVAFADAVLNGKPYVHLYLDIIRAQFEVTVLEHAHAGAYFKQYGRELPDPGSAPENSLAAELELVLAEAIEDLERPRNEYARRANAWIDKWCDDHPVEMEIDTEEAA